MTQIKILVQYRYIDVLLLLEIQTLLIVLKVKWQNRHFDLDFKNESYRTNYYIGLINRYIISNGLINIFSGYIKILLYFTC